MLHAITVTLVRLGITKRRLLEWETAAASAASRRAAAAERVREGDDREPARSRSAAWRWSSLVRPHALAGGGAGARAVGGGAADRVRAQPARCRPAARCSAPRTASFSQSVARKTWRYFETFVGPEDHALPPDNVQIVPELTVAHRTSPTNIGMALLATLAAHDFGFIDTDDLADRIDATLTTVESLERFEGHLLNWYDTRTLAPLPPAYVSTVDSGNLAGALLTLSVALSQLAPDDAPSARRRLDASGRREPSRCSTA